MILVSASLHNNHQYIGSANKAIAFFDICLCIGKFQTIFVIVFFFNFHKGKNVLQVNKSYWGLYVRLVRKALKQCSNHLFEDMWMRTTKSERKINLDCHSRKKHTWDCKEAKPSNYNFVRCFAKFLKMV